MKDLGRDATSAEGGVSRRKLRKRAVREMEALLALPRRPSGRASNHSELRWMLGASTDRSGGADTRHRDENLLDRAKPTAAAATRGGWWSAATRRGSG